MKTDFLERRAARLNESAASHLPKVRPSESPPEMTIDTAIEWLLRRFRGIDWTEYLKGASFNFGVKYASGEETFFVDPHWHPDNDGEHGSSWPTIWRPDLNADVVIRLVGRGVNYARAVDDQLALLSPGAPWVAGAKELIIEGCTCNPRARRTRARHVVEPDGREISGQEVRMERTFVARRGIDGLPLAVWKIGYRLFFAASTNISSRGAVPVLQLELLDAWNGAPQPPPSLQKAFGKVFQKLVVEAFMDIGPSLEVEIADEDESLDIPFGLRICLPPDMEGAERSLHDSLMTLFEEDGYSEALTDGHTAVQWVEVVCLPEPPGMARAQEDARVAESKAAAEASRAAVGPGDEFLFLAIDVRELYQGRGGRYFPIARAPNARPAAGLRLLVLCDSATGAQAVRLTKGDEASPVLSFLNSATQIPAKGLVPPGRPKRLYKDERGTDVHDPGGLTLLTRPRRLMVARSQVDKTPEIAAWCSDCGVALVHPKTGLGVLASAARVWRADLFHGGGRRDFWNVGATFEQLARHLEELCWVLNEIPLDEPGGTRLVPDYYSGQKGADISRFRAWRTSLVSSAWGST